MVNVFVCLKNCSRSLLVRKLGFTVFKKICEEFMLNFCQVIKLELKNVLH